MFVGKGVLKIGSKFTGEHPCRSAISINLQSNFIEITLRHRCSPVNLLHVFRTPFSKNTSGLLLLSVCIYMFLYPFQIKKFKFLSKIRFFVDGISLLEVSKHLKASTCLARCFSIVLV